MSTVELKFATALKDCGPGYIEIVRDDNGRFDVKTMEPAGMTEVLGRKVRLSNVNMGNITREQLRIFARAILRLTE